MVDVPLQRALNTKDDQKPKHTRVLLRKTSVQVPHAAAFGRSSAAGVRENQPSCEAEGGQGRARGTAAYRTIWRWKIATGMEGDELQPVSHLFISAVLRPMINAAATLSAASPTTETQAPKKQASTREVETSRRGS